MPHRQNILFYCCHFNFCEYYGLFFLYLLKNFFLWFSKRSTVLEQFLNMKLHRDYIILYISSFFSCCHVHTFLICETIALFDAIFNQLLSCHFIIIFVVSNLFQFEWNNIISYSMLNELILNKVERLLTVVFKMKL